MDLVLQQSRVELRLGRQLGRGGEGTIFAVNGRPDQAAKIYAVPPEPAKIRKLAVMSRVATPDLLGIAAWPADLLADVDGNVLGFVMPRVKAKQDIHELYSPKSRSEAFPDADFRFLVGVAANVARAFGTLHRAGHLVGDVNHGNLLVGPDGTVSLIDCDSIQVTDGSEVFTCDVGVPLFTAPELQGRPFRGLVRTENHDRFGLAVLLFHLLYMGRHPYAGRYAGPDDMPIERAIAEDRFAYGVDRSLGQMERPPGAIALEAMGASVERLFDAAFSRMGAGEGRPDAESWVKVLGGLASGLQPCRAVATHSYPGHLDGCPWCETEAQTGAQLFGRRADVLLAGAGDIEALVAAIASVPGPGPMPPLPSVTLSARRSRTPLGRPAPAARMEWERLLTRWDHEATAERFEQRRRELQSCWLELGDLPNQRSERLSVLEANRDIGQLRRHLDQFRIAGANIRGIGPGRTAMLASYGIETAADISRRGVAAIPTFNRMLAHELVRWRREKEASFRYHPNQPVDRRDIEALDLELLVRRNQLVAMLREGPVALRSLAAEIRVARERLLPLLEKAWEALA